MFEGSLRFLHHWRILNKHRVTDFQIRWFYVAFIVSVVFHFLFLLEVARAEFDRSRLHVGDLGNFDVHGTSEKRHCWWYASCAVWRRAIIQQKTMHLWLPIWLRYSGCFDDFFYRFHKSLHFCVGSGPQRCNFTMSETQFDGKLFEFMTRERRAVVGSDNIRNSKFREGSVELRNNDLCRQRWNELPESWVIVCYYEKIFWTNRSKSDTDLFPCSFWKCRHFQWLSWICWCSHLARKARSNFFLNHSVDARKPDFFTDQRLCFCQTLVAFMS